MSFKPKTVDKQKARDEFFKMVEEIQASMKDVDPKEIDAAIEEAIRAVRKSKSKTAKKK